ncbi:C-glycoside deglycosidase beta subunit domain-containing protein [Nocardiopsis sp. LOL_012]|uniref:C-glycoside deglycosidase beta subunit domain-containing protein n=1 Tax=Nocardiopsis sp. LOL_012 TaxID=3345409 RepID=UPI003A8559FB
MLERDLIQSVGFRNVVSDGEATGYRFRVRIPSYRGMSASLIDGISVAVDGAEPVPAHVPTWTLGGRTYTLEQLWASEGVRWPLEEAAVVTVPCPGGLAPGTHELAVEIRLRMSYIPLEHQPTVVRSAKRLTLSPETSGDGRFRYGVSLYSHMHDYGTVLDLDAALASIADVGATGVEILGEGHVPGYPEPSAEWIDAWFAGIERHGLEPTNYGSWIDTRLRPGRSMTVEEGAVLLGRDLRLAARLGFGFVRPKIGVVSSDLVPDPIWEGVVERCLETAQDLGIVICPEIHAPTPIRHRVVEDYVAFIERTGTEHFGLLIDTGIFQDRPIPLREGETRESRPAFLDGIATDPADLALVAEHVVFVQAKFHDIDEDLTDRNIPWEPVLRALADIGYSGYLSSAYEGDRSPWRSIEQVRRHHALLRRLESEL